ncbi:hypothetical protein PROFUN_06930 [Planoprotostelium fungivorum]|uniref:Uncharacterized protein n=1 Tax=Planoprotostelium fungivorum TaxID=1890364 RepID=A0A2P6NN56_9EUKA|nr:hypothetical protein PROFUN_06930 [Planoprotostelium fungivorum]
MSSSSLRTYNGLTEEEINRRAKPVKKTPSGDVIYDDEETLKHPSEEDYVYLLRSIRSEVGWIVPHGGVTNSISQIIEKDEAIVTRDLNLTHDILADHLQRLMENCTGRRAQFQYTATPLTSQSQSFTVDHYQLRGFQTSLFYNIENDTEEDAWSDEYHVRNNAVDLKLHVGGNVRRGALSHIRKYAFYGGGIENVFRIDPHRLVTVLTGLWNEESLKQEVTLQEISLQKSRQRVEVCRAAVQDASMRVQQVREQITAAKDASVKEKNILREVLSQEEEEVEYQKGTVEEAVEEVRRQERRLAELRGIKI